MVDASINFQIKLTTGYSAREYTSSHNINFLVFIKNIIISIDRVLKIKYGHI